MRIDYDLVADALTSVDLDPDMTVREHYTGEFMLGATCFALAVDQLGDVLRFFVALGYGYGFADARPAVCLNPDEADDLARATHTEQTRGGGLVVYFPGWQLDHGHEQVTLPQQRGRLERGAKGGPLWQARYPS